MFLEVDNLDVSESKRQSLRATFRDGENLSENETLYEEDLSRVSIFLFTVVKELLLVPGLREDFCAIFDFCFRCLQHSLSAPS